MKVLPTVIKIILLLEGKSIVLKFYNGGIGSDRVRFLINPRVIAVEKYWSTTCVNMASGYWIQ